MKTRRRILVVGALGLLSQPALSGEAEAGGKPEELRVSTERPETAAPDPGIETSTDAVIDAINRRIAEDLERRLEAIGNARIELATSEFPTRG